MWCSDCEMNSILICRNFFVSLQHRSHAFLRHFNNGKAVPMVRMHSGGFLTMGTASPRVPPRNDRWTQRTYTVRYLFFWCTCVGCSAKEAGYSSDDFKSATESSTWILTAISGVYFLLNTLCIYVFDIFSRFYRTTL